MGFSDRIDRAIVAVAPKWGLSRIRHRLAAKVIGNYSSETLAGRISRQAQNKANAFRSGANRAADHNRLTGGWNPLLGSADADTIDDLPTTRSRARDLVRNDGHAAGIALTMTSNVIGTGITGDSVIDHVALGLDESKDGPRKTLEAHRAAQESIWRRWERTADVTGRLTFGELQQQCYRAVLESGDVFLVRRAKNDPNRKLAFCWQVIEADRVDSPTTLGGKSEVKDGNTISGGVELDSDGAPVAYWIRKTHPGEDVIFKMLSRDAADFERIPAFDDKGRPNVLHLYFQLRPGQTRGMPFFAPVMLLFQNLSDYMEAELVAARLSACLALIFSKDSSNDDATDRPLGETEEDTDGRTEEEWQPGMMMNVTDTTITQVDPKRPGEHFEPFVARVLRQICAGMGLPYELVSKDYSRSNYSNMRAALLDARRLFKMQQLYFAEHLCQPSWELVMEESWLRRMWGRNIKAFRPDFDAWMKVAWLPNGWDWVDPPKEVKAEIAAVEANLISHSAATAKRGQKSSDILLQNSRVNNKIHELGLRDENKEIAIDTALNAMGIATSEAKMLEMYHREAPVDEGDSSVKVVEEPDNDNDENKDSQNGPE